MVRRYAVGDDFGARLSKQSLVGTLNSETRVLAVTRRLLIRRMRSCMESSSTLTEPMFEKPLYVGSLDRTSLTELIHARVGEGFYAEPKRLRFVG